MKRIGQALGLSVAAIAAMAITTPAEAEYVGGDEITVLQGFAPGGGSDALAQLIQPYLAEELGISFVNQYQPGATGAIAWTQLAKSVRPDGRTISITNTPMLTTNYIMNESITYTIDELTPIANIVTDPGLIVVGADSPYQTVEDLFEDARNRPGEVTIGNSGVGGDDFFSTIMVERATGLEFQKVPFQGDGPSWTAAMGGQIDASFNNLGITYPQIQAGNLRVLAIFTEERIDELPDVPTLREMDIDVVAGSSRGYSGPAGFPEEAREQLIAAMERVMENEAFQQAARDRAMRLDFIAGEDYMAYLRNDEEVFGDIWEEIKDSVQE